MNIKNTNFHKDKYKKYHLLRKIRPSIFSDLILKIIGVGGRRIIFKYDSIELYINPLNSLGHDFIHNGVYEEETFEIIRQYLVPGSLFVDIGANEGVFSAFAGYIVGDSGIVIAIEPQSRLIDIIKINLSLNRVKNYHILQNAISDTNDKLTLNLFPENNTGASSLFKKYRLSSQRELVETITFESVVNKLNIKKINFIKIDVEGYEGRVIQSLLKIIKIGMVEYLYVDYHREILEKNGYVTNEIHNSILSHGMKYVKGDSDLFSGYILYKSINYLEN
jgi:FkbM family methyltransferase